MKKYLKVAVMAVLTLIALSPLVLAGQPTKTFHKPTPPTNFNHKPTFNHNTTFNHNQKFDFHHDRKFDFHHDNKVDFRHDNRFDFRHDTTFNHKPFKPGFPVVNNNVTVNKFVTVNNYVQTHGTKFSHGVFFAGTQHSQWTKRFYSPTWQTWCWYCPSANGWFYHNAAKGGFYPVSYLGVSAPTAVAPTAALIPPGGGKVPVVTDGPELPAKKG